MRIIPIIIPAYEPDHRLISLLESMAESEIAPVVLVNDGSGEEYNAIFEKAKEIIEKQGGVVITHEVNMGKGRALKTAFRYVLDNMPDAIGVVTADSDGQHTPKSIESVRNRLTDNALILGVRNFDESGIPWKSRTGNLLTEKIFSYVSGVHVTDTQTGLRGIPKRFLAELLEVKGDRFEYEMRMLLEVAGKYDIAEVPIETIYDSEKNHQTHFNPWKDSIRIYRILGEKFFKYIFSSLTSCIIDLILFTVFCNIYKYVFAQTYIIFATVSARVFSVIYNYTLNYIFVFKSGQTLKKSAFKYVILAILQMLASAICVYILANIVRILPEVVIKIIVDTGLFFCSYYIQKKYVFR